MKRLENNVFVYLLIMFAFLCSMLFGIFYGPDHPQVFFWMIMIVFAVVVGLYVATTIKDVVILVVGMVFLGIGGSVVEGLILAKMNEGLFKFILECVCLAPFYCPVAAHFWKMSVKKRKMLDKKS